MVTSDNLTIFECRGSKVEFLTVPVQINSFVTGISCSKTEFGIKVMPDLFLLLLNSYPKKRVSDSFNFAPLGLVYLGD